MDDLFVEYERNLPGLVAGLTAADKKLGECIRSDLAEFGYTVVPGVIRDVAPILAAFDEWVAATPQLQSLYRAHGIYKHGQAGHQEFAWSVRTHPEVLAVHRLLYECSDLVVSFDGACHLAGEKRARKETGWTHTDQSPFTKGAQPVQGFVALTANEDSTFVVYEKSNREHARYFAARVDGDAKWKKNFLCIDPAFLAEIEHTRKVVAVNAGDLVLWDSRTFHCNQRGTSGKRRVVQYVAYAPKADPRNTAAVQVKRRKYFHERRMTTHRPYPPEVVGVQPQTYGDARKLVDYDLLPEIDLRHMQSAIDALI